MNYNKLFKRVIATLSSAAIMLTSSGLPYSTNMIANAEPITQEQISQLADVTDLHWVEDSSATVSWTSVAEANYYAVTVTVYETDGTTLIGSTDTGTTDTELDVQQEIHDVIGDIDYDAVKVMATVVAQKKQDDVVVMESDEFTTGLWEYRLVVAIKLPTPTDVTLSEDGILRFKYEDELENAEINIDPKVQYDDKEYNNEFSVGNPNELIYNDGYYTCDITNVNKKLYKRIIERYNLKNVDNISVSWRISIFSNSSSYLSSDYSDYSNPIELSLSLEKFPTPTDVSLSEDGILSFKYDGIIDSKKYNQVSISSKVLYQDQEFSFYSSSVYRFDYKDGYYSCDISDANKSVYIYGIKYNSYSYYRPNYESGDTISLAWKVRINSNSLDIISSDYSDYSNYIDVTLSPTKLSTPTDVSLSDDGILSFKYDGDFDKSKIWINVSSKIISNDQEFSSFGYGFSVNGFSYNGGYYSYDLSTKNNSLYKWGVEENYYNSGDTINIAWKIKFTSNSTDYLDGEYSDYSNPIQYDPEQNMPKVNITITPSTPIICVGNSYCLNKKIEPKNTQYDSIDWTSENDSIISVDADGKITGIAPGTANVTAAIKKYNDIVPVTVYNLTSNIKDEDIKDSFINIAGNIIDDIANNDKPNIYNTDIDKNKITDLRQEIIDAAQNGAEFWINSKDYGNDLDHYREYWDNLQFSKWFNRVCGESSDWEFICGCSMVYELGYTDADGEDHHIGNIKNFTKNYEQNFEIPENTQINELQDGKNRIYSAIKIVNLNGNQYNYIADLYVDIDGKFKVKSDQPAEFILLYKDIDDTEEQDTITLNNEEYGININDIRYTDTNENITGEYKYSVKAGRPISITSDISFKIGNITAEKKEDDSFIWTGYLTRDSYIECIRIYIVKPQNFNFIEAYYYPFNSDWYDNLYYSDSTHFIGNELYAGCYVELISKSPFFVDDEPAQKVDREYKWSGKPYTNVRVTADGYDTPALMKTITFSRDCVFYANYWDNEQDYLLNPNDDKYSEDIGYRLLIPEGTFIKVRYASSCGCPYNYRGYNYYSDSMLPFKIGDKLAYPHTDEFYDRKYYYFGSIDNDTNVDFVKITLTKPDDMIISSAYEYLMEKDKFCFVDSQAIVDAGSVVDIYSPSFFKVGGRPAIGTETGYRWCGRLFEDTEITYGGKDRPDFSVEFDYEYWAYGDIPTPKVKGNDGNGKITFEYFKETETDFYSIGDTIPTELGNYWVAATVAETENYLSAKSFARFSIVKDCADKDDFIISGISDNWTDEPGAPGVYEYDGKPHTGNITPKFDDLEFSVLYNGREDEPIEPGNYRVEVTTKENEHFYSSTVEIGEIIINRAEVNVTITGHTGTFDYDGKEHRIEGYDINFSNKLYDAKKLTYTIYQYYTWGITPGKYYMNMYDASYENKDNGYYVNLGIIDGWMVINKAAPTADLFDFHAPTDLIYNNDSVQPYVTVKDNIYGMGEISSSSYKYRKDGTDVWSTNIPKNAGKYYLGMSIEEGRYYNSADFITDESWCFTIEKADISGSDVTVDTEEQSVTLKYGNMIIPNSEYIVKYGKNADSATLEYPIEPGNYYAFINATGINFTGSVKSEIFTIFDWDNPTYTWSNDNKTCTATRVCKNDETHIETETVNAKSSRKIDPTCTAKGTTTYTAEFENSAFAKQTKDIQNIVATGHDWKAATYKWSADNKTCTASRVCKNDASHVETETVNAKSSRKIAPTCTAKGTTTYTAEFQNIAFAKQTKDVQDIAKKEHSWSEWKVTKPATEDAEGVETRECSVCHEKETSPIDKLEKKSSSSSSKKEINSSKIEKNSSIAGKNSSSKVETISSKAEEPSSTVLESSSSKASHASSSKADNTSAAASKIDKSSSKTENTSSKAENSSSSKIEKNTSVVEKSSSKVETISSKAEEPSFTVLENSSSKVEVSIKGASSSKAESSSKDASSAMQESSTAKAENTSSKPADNLSKTENSSSKVESVSSKSEPASSRPDDSSKPKDTSRHDNSSKPDDKPVPPDDVTTNDETSDNASTDNCTITDNTDHKVVTIAPKKNEDGKVIAAKVDVSTFENIKDEDAAASTKLVVDDGITSIDLNAIVDKFTGLNEITIPDSVEDIIWKKPDGEQVKLKFICSSTSSAAVFAVAAGFDVKYTDVKHGDPTGDGNINVTDIAVTASHIKGIKALNDVQKQAADVNDDGDVNVTDIAMIAAHIKGIKAIG